MRYKKTYRAHFLGPRPHPARRVVSARPDGTGGLRDIVSRWWPLILVAIGLWQLISSNFQELAGGLFLIALGPYFSWQARDPGKSLWHYVWPALIIGLGSGSYSGLSALFAARLSAARRRPGRLRHVRRLNRRIESQNFRGEGHGHHGRD